MVQQVSAVVAITGETERSARRRRSICAAKAAVRRVDKIAVPSVHEARNAMTKYQACTVLLTALAVCPPAGAQGPPPLQPPIAPLQNPVTPAKAYLGKTLFWDEQMSSTGTMACATCHLPEAGGADPRAPLANHPGADR